MDDSEAERSVERKGVLRHAHLEFFDGVTAESIIMACWKACGLRPGDELWRDFLRSVSEASNAQVCLDILENDESNFIGIIRMDQEGNLEWKPAFDAFEKRLNGTTMSTETVRRCRQAFGFLRVAFERAIPPLSGTAKEPLQTACEVVLMGWFFDRLHIHNVSYKEIAITGESLGQLGKFAEPLKYLLEGFDVVLGDGNVSSLLNCSVIAFLKTFGPNTTQKASSFRFVSSYKGVYVSNDVKLPTTFLTIGTVPETLPSGSPEKRWNIDDMVLLEANVDDITAEHLAFCVERLFESGAADAWTSAAGMKKGRQAHTIHVLSSVELQNDLLEVLFRHSTSLGVRIRTLQRASLRREIVTVQTAFTAAENGGVVKVKVAYLEDEIVSMKAEFDHCRIIARHENVPIQRIADEAVELAGRVLHRT